MISHSTHINVNWLTDGEFDANIIRVANTGNANTDYLLDNPLGREPVGVQIIMTNKHCNVIVKSKDSQKIVVQFSESNCDLNLRIW